MNKFSQMNKSERQILRTELNKLSFATTADQAEKLSTAAQQKYLDQHFDRFCYTSDLISNYLPNIESARILDIGSFPYYLPAILSKRFGSTIEAIDLPKEAYWPGTPYKQSSNIVRINTDGEPLSIKQHVVNIETDSFEPDELFDAVIFTEILEHLLLQPNHAFEQIHRALKPGGIVVVTTPNAQYLMKVLSMLRGKNLYEKYNLGLGAYGRHNREYLLSEVASLLKEHNFNVVHGELKNLAKPHLTAGEQRKYKFVEALTKLPFLKSRQENIFVVATKHGRSVCNEPASLFHHWTE